LIACLPMYDWPELTQAHDAMWQELGDRLRTTGIDAPDCLSRDSGDERFWLDPDLLLGQTCGYPLATKLRGKVQYVATPVYEVKGCSGPLYSSAIVTRKDADLTMDNWQQGRFVFNSQMSLSGYRAVRAMIGKPESFFTSVAESGGHRLSARMVAKGNADVAALDAVCWHLLQEHEPATASQLKVICWTQKRPALPLITSLATSRNINASLREVLRSISPPDKLAISGFEVLKKAEYEQLSAL